MKKIVVVLAVASALALCACGSSAPASSSASSDAAPSESAQSESSQPEQAPEVSEQASDLFDGSAFSDTGAGTMYLATAGGTSEDGNVPQIAFSGDPANSAMSIELDFWDGDGSVCTIYVDGMEGDKMNAGNVQQSITLWGDMLEEGVHTVEVVKMDGDAPVIYKKAQYEIVK